MTEATEDETSERRPRREAASDLPPEDGSILDVAPWQAFSLDPGARYTYLNEAHSRFIASLCGRATGLGADHTECFPSETREAAKAAFQKALGGSEESVDMLHGPPGQRRRFRFSYRPLAGADGSAGGVAGFGLDVTEATRTEHDLHASEERYRRLAENAPDIIFRYDLKPDMRLTYINEAVLRITGYTPEECYADPLLMINLAHPDDAPLMADLARSLTVPEEPTVMRWIGKDGAIRWMESRIVPVFADDGSLCAVEGVTRDVTAARLAEEALAASERKYQQLVESSPAAITIVQSGGIVFSNGRLQRLTGYSEPELTQGDPFRVIHPEDREVVRGYLTARTAGREAPSAYEFRVVRRDGETRWLSRRVVPVTWEGSAALMTVDTDVTEARRSQDALRTNEERLRLALSVADISVFSQDSDLRYTWVHPHLWGHPPERVVGRLDAELLPDPAAREVTRVKRRVLGTGVRADAEFAIGPMGEGSAYLLLVEPLRASDGTVIGVTGAALDVSAKKRAEQAHAELEDRLHQSQRLESLGLLAGGIAHDFNNLLTVITGTADLAMADAAEIDKLRSDLREVRKAAERASILTRQLLAFSRNQVMSRRPLDLNETVSRKEGLIRSLLGEAVELVIAPAADLGRVRADPAQMEQVLLNLVLNARDAMPHGGRVTISTADVDLDADFALEHPGVEPGPHVALRVADSGTGMDEATRTRIFEPFFTTKPPGRGTGLGLATVWGVVTQSNGTVWVESTPGVGSDFTIYLPRTEDRPAEPEPSPPEATGAGSETVLVVEDEQALRRMVTRILTMNGYRVLTASSGEEALTLLAREAGAVDLLLTDVVMPGISGPELAARGLAAQPGLRVLFMSGYTDDDVLRRGVETARAHFISKPYTAGELARKVRETLDHAAPVSADPPEESPEG